MSFLAQAAYITLFYLDLSKEQCFLLCSKHFCCCACMLLSLTSNAFLACQAADTESVSGKLDLSSMNWKAFSSFDPEQTSWSQLWGNVTFGKCNASHCMLLGKSLKGTCLTMTCMSSHCDGRIFYCAVCHGHLAHVWHRDCQFEKMQ